MNILIRADSSSSIGLGHIMRDIALAKKYPDDTVTFACRDLEGAMISQIPYPVHILQGDTPEELIALIQKLNITLLIIDHYAISYDQERSIKSAIPALTLMVLDDTYNAHECDILLNHNIYADVSRYKALVPDHCDLQCGSRYTLIREAFHHEKTKQRSKNYDIIIAMGGSDAANLTLRVLNTLDEDLHVSILTTTANQNLESLRHYVATRPHTTLHVNTPDVAAIMHQSRLGIITPSVMVHEALFLDLPFIAIQSAQNQSEMVAYLRQHDYSVLRTFHPLTLQALVHRERNHIKCIDFTALSLAHKEMILRWRNHSNIRKWMYRDTPISAQEHFAFIDTLTVHDNKKYYLVNRKDDPIGVIDFTHITQTDCDIGLYANPELNAVGSLLMEQILYLAFEVMQLQKIRAQAFDDNTKALQLYKKFNFKKVDTASINQRPVSVLELCL